MSFCGEVCYSSWLWKFALLFGLVGLACSAYGLVTPNFVSSSPLNGSENLKWGLFEYCELPYDSDSLNCEMYPKEREEVYLLISRYIILGAVVCGLFGTVSHFLSPLHRAYFKTKHSIYYFIAGVVTAVVGNAVFVHYKMDDTDRWIHPGPKPFTVNVSWSFYAFIATAVIFLLAAVFCALEVRRDYSERRRYRDSYMMADRS